MKKNIPCLSGYGLYSIDIPACKIVDSEKAISYENLKGFLLLPRIFHGISALSFLSVFKVVGEVS